MSVEIIDQSMKFESQQSDSSDKVLINIVTRDGKKFQVPENVLTISSMFKEMFESDDYDGSDIPVDILSYVFEKVLEYLNKYVNDPMPRIDPHEHKDELENIKEFNTYITEWYWNYIKDIPILQETDEGVLTLYELVVNANYLDVKPLVSLCLAHIAFLIKDKEPEEISRLMDLKKELTPEAQKEILSKPENAWILETSDDEEEKENKENN